MSLNPDRLKCDRRQFFDAMYAENTCPQVHYLPVYWHSYYEMLGYERVLNVGGVIDTSWIKEDDRIGAALLAWQGGMEGGFGRV